MRIEAWLILSLRGLYKGMFHSVPMGLIASQSLGKPDRGEEQLIEKS